MSLSAFCWALVRVKGRLFKRASSHSSETGKRLRFHRFPIALLAQHSHLQIKDLVEGQSFTRGFELFLRVREVDLQQRFCQRHQAGRGTGAFRQCIRDAGRPIFNDLLHHIAQPFLCDALGQRIDRHDAIGVQAFHLNRFPIRAVHHEPAKILIDLA